ncbi:hypothetical protein X777_11953, partial [Ooceraea biroi]
GKSYSLGYTGDAAPRRSLLVSQKTILVIATRINPATRRVAERVAAFWRARNQMWRRELYETEERTVTRMTFAVLKAPIHQESRLENARSSAFTRLLTLANR